MKPGLLDFMEAHGLLFGPVATKALKPGAQWIAKHDLVISLEGPVSNYLPEQPFRTVFLDWDVGDPPDDLADAATADRYTELYREITARIRDLMETLRGEEAD